MKTTETYKGLSAKPIDLPLKPGQYFFKTTFTGISSEIFFKAIGGFSISKQFTKLINCSYLTPFFGSKNVSEAAAQTTPMPDAFNTTIPIPESIVIEEGVFTPFVNYAQPAIKTLKTFQNNIAQFLPAMPEWVKNLSPQIHKPNRSWKILGISSDFALTGTMSLLFAYVNYKSSNKIKNTIFREIVSMTATIGMIWGVSQVFGFQETQEITKVVDRGINILIFSIGARLVSHPLKIASDFILRQWSYPVSYQLDAAQTRLKI